MPTITSGPSYERLLRAGALMLLVDVFTFLFLWDGFIGYARKNAAELAGLLGSEQVLTPDSRRTAAWGRESALRLKAGEPLEAVTARLGAPTAVKDDTLYYLGRGGWLQVHIQNGRVQDAAWTTAKHSEADQRWQRWIGYALALVGVAATIHFGLVAATRATVDELGVRLNGRKVVPWEAITGLRPVSGHTGAVDLEFVANGEPERVRLDDYRYKNLDAVAAVISERKGFENPLAMG
jgi:hypothetical protein